MFPPAAAAQFGGRAICAMMGVEQYYHLCSSRRKIFIQPAAPYPFSI